MKKQWKGIILIVFIITSVGCLSLKEERIGHVHPEGHPDNIELKDFSRYHNITEIDLKILKLMEKHQVAGLQAAVTIGNSLVWDNAYGWFDLNEETEMQRNHMIRIASISKSFACLGAMNLESEGLLDLEEDINTYLDLPVSIRNPHHPEIIITTRQLMNHTSSILSGQHAAFVINSRNQDPVPYTLADYFGEDGKFNKPGNWSEHPPGEHFQYSNMATVVLAAIIENISGQEFSQYMRKNIFIPLDMADSSFNASDLDKTRIARMYRRIEENGTVAFTWTPVPPGGYYSRYLPGSNGGLHSPQGGMISSAADLSNFVLVMTNEGQHRNRQLFPAETINKMHQKSVKVEHNGPGTFNGLYKKKGLGIHISDDLYPGQRVFGHFGSSYGVITNMYYSLDREENFGIIFLINGSNTTRGSRSPFRKLDEELAELLYTHFVHQ